MKEKRDSFGKGKQKDEHPFAPYLYEDEKILWMDGALTASPTSPVKNYIFVSLTCVVIWFILISLTLNISTATSTTLPCLFLMAGVAPLVLGSDWKRKDSPRGLYALTDRHVFYWDGSKVIERTLEAVHPIGLVPGAGSQGTLSFGNGFPSWPNIDDAAYVKTMIEQAQKHRFEEERDEDDYIVQELPQSHKNSMSK